MKLKKLIIKNFRGLKGEKNIIDFSGSNIIFLIGQNNVGKSSFLRAYEFFVNSSEKASITDFYNHDTNVPIIIEGEFIKEENDVDDLDLAGKAKGKAVEPDWIAKWVHPESNIVRVRKEWIAKDELFKKYTLNPATDQWTENGFGGLHTLFQKYTPTPISISAMETESSLEEKVNKLIQEDFLKKLRNDYPEQFASILEGIVNLQNEISGSDIIQSYNNDINEYFKKIFADLTLKIEPKHEDNIKLEDIFKKNHSVNIRKQGNDRSENFTQHGHGVIRQALFNFISFLKKEIQGQRKEYIILFEEPELFLHPEAVFKLRKSLYELAENSPYQILCATHSPLMIDISKPHSSLVRVMKNNDEMTETHQVGDDVFRGDNDKKQKIQMINRFNPHVCESFYASKVIVVEGDTEAIVFRDLINRFYERFEIYVLNAGSKNNIPFFQEIFTAFHIEHYAIHDSDTRINGDGSVNSAWTLNTSIWDKIVEANALKINLARRYVHMTNFEVAHNINLTGKEKPLNAYNFTKGLDENSDVPCLVYLKDIIGNKEILHDEAYVQSLK